MHSLVFFGSFQNFSTQTLQKIISSGLFKINAVITTAAKPGDRGVLTKTHTQLFCEANNIPVYPLDNLDDIPKSIQQPDFVFVSGFGKWLNEKWINFPRIMAINAHQSLLPNYAGRFPAQWAILNGETTTGVTLIKMSSEFDRGDILAQSKIEILTSDTAQTLYSKLYDLSADLFIKTAPKIDDIIPIPQSGTGFYARQLTKADGYFNNFENLDRKVRALNPWPGVWTYVADSQGKKLIMKVISLTSQNELQDVLIEGKKPTTWSQISQYYTLTTEPKN